MAARRRRFFFRFHGALDRVRQEHGQLGTGLGRSQLHLQRGHLLPQAFDLGSGRRRRLGAAAGQARLGRVQGAFQNLLPQLVEALLADVQPRTSFLQAGAAGDSFQDGLDPLLGEVRAVQLLDVLRSRRASSAHVGLRDGWASSQGQRQHQTSEVLEASEV